MPERGPTCLKGVTDTTSVCTKENIAYINKINMLPASAIFEPFCVNFSKNNCAGFYAPPPNDLIEYPIYIEAATKIYDNLSKKFKI